MDDESEKSQKSEVSEIERALWVSAEAATLNFDWVEPIDIMDKVIEEVDEIREAYRHSPRVQLKEELGDLLFTVINACRLFEFDPTEVLRRANDKFEERFELMKILLNRDHVSSYDLSVEELDAYWQEAKKILYKKGPKMVG